MQRKGMISAAVTMAAVELLAGSASAATYSWGFDAAGNWSDSTVATGWNASGAYPNAMDDIANLSLNVTAGRTVTINVTDAIVGSLSLDDTGTGTDSAWTIASSDATNNKLTFAVSSGNGVLNSSGGSNVISAPVVVNSTLQLTASSALTLSGQLTGAGSIQKLGASTVTLGHSNNTIGDLAIAAGTVSLTNNSSTASHSVGNLSITGGTLSFAQAGRGAFAVSGSTSVSSGTISAITGNPKVMSLGALSLSGGTIVHDQFNTTGGLTINATGLSITNTASSAYTPIRLETRTGGANPRGTLNLSGDLAFTGNATNTNATIIDLVIRLAGGTPAKLVLSGTGTTTFEIGDGAATTDLVIRPEISGSKALNKSGAGTLGLEAVNIYTGATNILNGTLALGASGSIASSPQISIAAGAIFDTTSQAFTMLGTQTIKFTLDPAGTGSAGLLNAGALDVTGGVVDFATVGTLDDSVYVLANYTSLNGGAANPVFSGVSNQPAGYQIDYDYNGGTQIALVIPEPAAAGLLTAAAGLSILRRRRH